MMVVNPPGSSSLARPTARCSSGNRWTRAPQPAVIIAVAKNKPEVGGNVASMPNLLGSLNCKVEKKARETRTKKQLHKPEEVPTCQESIHRQLSMVDVLQKIGISRHFASEIKSILDFTYSYWLRRDEIMLDVETCAMAFRTLRMNGYNVSADGLSHISTDLSDTRSLLELYKASQVSTSDDELILDIIGSWSGHLLRQQLKSSEAQRTPLLREVEHVLDSPFYTMLDRLEHKRNIEQFDIIEHPILQLYGFILFFCKLSAMYTHTTISSHFLSRTSQTNQDLLALGVMDFSTSQSIYQQEYQHLDRWEQQEETEYYSEQVEIVFSAIYISWQELLRNMMTEVEWRTGGYVPTLDEYIENAVVTFALGPIVLPALYFVGPKITESMVIDPEYMLEEGLKPVKAPLVDSPLLAAVFSTTSKPTRYNCQTPKKNDITIANKKTFVDYFVAKGIQRGIPEARRKLQKPIDTCRRDLLRETHLAAKRRRPVRWMRWYMSHSKSP
ncbi:unnamed protein product [Triticum turgidum subsp. durum]|uniref:Uncharacterized protein n=1 Tax=Triticum turgidum subsp. durum TaxID=4567 RepID=A0A9R1P353_TRITD|nr:unnamed protein product [Triticum turgidum subsp. durum]